jgi:hypothetical protein
VEFPKKLDASTTLGFLFFLFFKLHHTHHSTTNDEDQGTTSKDLIQVPIGPVTRARAKKFKDVLNGLIQELWAQANLLRPIEHDPQGQQRIITLIQVLEGSGQG